MNGYLEHAMNVLHINREGVSRLVINTMNDDLEHAMNVLHINRRRCHSRF